MVIKGTLQFVKVVPYTVHCGSWHCGNIVGHINEVTLRQARLVLGWMTCSGSTPEGGTLFWYVTSHAG